MNKKLLATAVVGAAFVISAVLIVSMKGNDKPVINTNPPPATEQPASNTEDTVVPVTPGDDDVPEEPEEPPVEPGDDDEPGNEGKATGLARAIEVHERNIEKMLEKGNLHAKGLYHSLDQLQLNMDKLEQKDVQQGEEHGQGHANGHANNEKT